MGTLRVVIIALLLFVAPHSALAQSSGLVTVAEPSTIGVDVGSATTFADLVRSSFAREGVAVLPRSDTPQQPCGEPACAPSVAAATQATSIVVLKLSQLGQKVIVDVHVVGRDGGVVMQDRITAASIEDLEPIAARIAVSVSTGTPLADSATVDTVTDNEAREPRRIQTMFTSGLRVGAMVPMRDSFGGANALTSWTLFGMFEYPQFGFIADLGFQSTADTDDDVGAFGFHLDLGGFKFLSPSSTSVYVGGGVGFRATSVDSMSGDDSASGPGVFASVGVVLLRTSDFHLIADARYDLNLFEMDGLAGNGRSHGLIASVGFSYAKFGRLFGR